MNKKGQAAMEFLMTYGWAILAAVIVVGVLWYLIGDPGSLAGNKFMMSSTEGILHNAMALDADADTIELEIRNGQAETITVTLIEVGDLCSSAVLTTTVSAGELQAFTISACTMESGDRVNEDVTFSFTTADSAVTQTATGTISGRVP